MLRIPNHIRRFATQAALALAFVVALCGAETAYAQNIPQPMSPARLVNDYAGLFSGVQKQQLEDSLVAFDRATSTQIAVVTVNDLDGYAASEYATRILEKWGVGQKGKDNGVVMLLKPRNENGGGEVFIAVGYGLEGALPDITAGRIIDSEMMPYLRGGDYYGAVAAGTAAVRAAVRGEYKVSAKDKGGDTIDWITGLLSLGVMIFIIIILNKSYKGGGDDDDSDGSGGGSNGRRNYRRGAVLFPPIIGGLGGMGGGRGGGGFGGGGFGGFGGGMGGGGGAGRSF